MNARFHCRLTSRRPPATLISQSAMGICASSSDVAENEMLKSKGGSVILQRKVHGAEAVLEVGKGDSIIIGPNSLDEWCPGQPIVRPAPLARSRPVEIDCGDRILVLTIGCELANRRWGTRGHQNSVRRYQTLQGKNPQPPHKPNQDSLIMHTEIGGRKDLGLLAVFDGHGPYGEHASVRGRGGADARGSKESTRSPLRSTTAEPKLRRRSKRAPSSRTIRCRRSSAASRCGSPRLRAPPSLTHSGAAGDARGLCYEQDARERRGSNGIGDHVHVHHDPRRYAAHGQRGRLTGCARHWCG